MTTQAKGPKDLLANLRDTSSVSETSSREVSMGENLSNIMNLSDCREESVSNHSDNKRQKNKASSKGILGEKRYKNRTKLDEILQAKSESYLKNHEEEGQFSSTPRAFPAFSRVEADDARTLSPALSPIRCDFKIDHFYKQEREKLNVWTYLFVNLNKAVQMMLTMCELEDKEEFCKGVIDTLEYAKKDFDKLLNKVKVEKITDQPQPQAWDILGQNRATIDNSLFQEFRNYAKDVTEEEQIEFSLLNEMVESGKMSFYEAVVLIVRERALLVEDEKNNNTSSLGLDMSHSSAENASYKSRSRSRSGDKPDLPGSGDHVNRVSFSRLIRRINFKGKYIKQLTEVHADDESRTSELLEEIESKQRRAKEARESQKNQLLERLSKKEEKIEQMKRKREASEKDKVQELNQKVKDSSKRRGEHIHEIKNKAREVNLKSREITFLMTLEKDVKKTTIDRKLLETHQRRLNILNKIREKQKKEDENVHSVQLRKEEIDNEKRSHLQSKIERVEEASKRRTELLEQRVKRNKRGRNGRRSSKHLVGASGKGKNYKDFIKAFMNPSKFKLEDEELEVKSCMPSPIKRVARRAKSLTSEPTDIADYHYSYIFFKPKEKEGNKKKIKRKDNFMNLEQVFAKKIRPPTNQPANIAAKRASVIQPGIGLTTSQTIIAKKSSTPVVIAAVGIESATKPQLKPAKSPISIGNLTPYEKTNGDAKTIPTGNAHGQESAKKKNQHKGSVNSMDEKEKPAETSKLVPNTNAINNQQSPSSSPQTGPYEAAKPTLGQHIQLTNPSFIEEDIVFGGQATIVSPKAAQNNLAVQGVTAEKSHNYTLSLQASPSIIHGSEKKLALTQHFNMQLDQMSGDEGLHVATSTSGRNMIRLCTLCDMVLIEEVSNEQHMLSKNHKKSKNQYSLTATEEKACIITCQPTDLAASRLGALKKKCKRIRQTLATLCSKNENLLLGKETVTSPNKTRLHKHAVDMEKLINNQFKDFKSIETILREVQKVLLTNNENDLQILRANKFLSYLIEICKSVNLCHKNDLGTFVKLLDIVLQLLCSLCSVKENRTYMLVTNRVIPLVDLLLWSWNNASKYIYCLNYIPQLFHLIGFLIRHKLPDNSKESYKHPVLEYIVQCGLLIKLKQRFTSFSAGLDLTSYAGKVPLALLKAISLLEIVTSHLEIPNIPFFDSTNTTRKLNESISFLLRETEVAGCLQLMSGLLLAGGNFKQLSKNYILPQTIFSVVMLIIKIFSNVARLDIEIVQDVLGSSVNEDLFYHCMMFLLDYCITNYENNDEVPELLNEAVLLLGYFSYLRPHNQSLMTRGHGSNTIVTKLTALPYNYFVGKTMEKDVLFPTLLCIVFKHEKNLRVLLKDMSVDLIVEYLQLNLALVQKHMHQYSETGSNFDTALLIPGKDDYTGSHSASSATSSANSIRLHPSATHHYLLPQRFSYEHWQAAITFLTENAQL